MLGDGFSAYCKSADIRRFSAPPPPPPPSLLLFRAPQVQQLEQMLRDESGRLAS
eukprot:COSAG01_NODE_74728_length_202_cov_10.980583_1_plen_53_part_01